ncbi:MAG TPA: GspH/FimT family pseudopilin [Gemmatimonadaceae bacterium]|nr:GspH/FimT family pseudopilin [Gemmatimonadaceae bacterium]
MTLTELVVVLALIGILALFARPAFGGLYDRSTVISATSELVAVIGTARQLAITEGRIVAVRLDAPAGRVVVFAGRDTFHVRGLRETHGVTLIASRDSIAFYPTGRGYGAANTSIIIERGTAADTVHVSRLGRVRR